MLTCLNNLRVKLSQGKLDAANVAAHTAMGIGVVCRCVSVASRLGRPLTPFDLGIMAGVVVFEAVRLEVALRLLR